jgi:hypothetical protein
MQRCSPCLTSAGANVDLGRMLVLESPHVGSAACSAHRGPRAPRTCTALRRAAASLRRRPRAHCVAIEAFDDCVTLGMDSWSWAHTHTRSSWRKMTADNDDFSRHLEQRDPLDTYAAWASLTSPTSGPEWRNRDQLIG